MKRTLSALALAAATFASVSVYAQNAQNPQPSFNDSAPVPAAQPATNSAAPAATKTAAPVVTKTTAAPLPSFNG